MSLGLVDVPRKFTTCQPPPHVVEDAISAEENSRTVPIPGKCAWDCCIYAAVLIPFALIVYTSVRVYIPVTSWWAPYALAALFFATSILYWARNMLSMNLFAKGRRTRIRFTAISLYMLAAFCGLASSFSVLQRESTMQFLASLCSSTLMWIGFIILFNGDKSPPSRQQLIALPQILFQALLWETRTLIINKVLDETSTSCS